MEIERNTGMNGQTYGNNILSYTIIQNQVIRLFNGAFMMINSTFSRPIIFINIFSNEFLNTYYNPLYSCMYQSDFIIKKYKIKF